MPKSAGAPAAKAAAQPAAQVSTPHASSAYLAPFGFMAGIAGIATFYLPQFVFPFVLSLAALGLGVAAYVQAPRERLAKIAMGLGGVGLVLEAITGLTG